MSFQERRRKERKPYINSIDIYSHENKKAMGKGFIMNWCNDGFGIISTHQLPKGVKLVLFCDLPNGQEFDFLGEVVYSQERVDSSAYGIKLLPGQTLALDRFLQQISIV